MLGLLNLWLDGPVAIKGDIFSILRLSCWEKCGGFSQNEGPRFRSPVELTCFPSFCVNSYNSSDFLP